MWHRHCAGCQATGPAVPSQLCPGRWARGLVCAAAGNRAALQAVPSLPSSFCQSHLPLWPPQNSLESMGAAFPKHDEEDEDMREKEVQMESLICAFETLGKAWPRSLETQRKSADDMQNKLFFLKMKSRREGPGDHVRTRRVQEKMQDLTAGRL